MKYLQEDALKGDRSFAAHTGMQRFPIGLRWRASENEEGVLLGRNGSLIAIMPGCSERLSRLGEADLIVFRRNGKLRDRIGCGGVVGSDGESYGLNGSFVCTVLQPRRIAPEIAGTMDDRRALIRCIHTLLQDSMCRGLEAALRKYESDPAQLRGAARVCVLEEMKEAAMRCGLLVEEFEVSQIVRGGNPYA